MSTDVPSQKAGLRAELRVRVRALGEAEWLALSGNARQLLRSRPEWREARSVLLYCPTRHELDIWPLVGEALAAGRLVALPRFDEANGRYEAAQIQGVDREMVVGRFGIREPDAACAPVALNQLDLVLVPGVGFDLGGRRLGRGKGYYDRLLSGVRGIRCGLAADCQVVSAVPSLPHDEPVDCILTPSRWIACRQRAV